jgi:hypothetical protein
MRYCRFLRIGLNLLISLSLEAMSHRLGTVSVSRKGLQLSHQSCIAFRESVAPGKEATSHCVDRTDSPEKTEAIINSGQLVSSDETEAKTLKVHEIVFVEDGALLRCELEVCRQASTEYIDGRGDSGEVIHDNIGFGLVQDESGLQNVADMAQGLEDKQFSFLQVVGSLPVCATHGSVEEISQIVESGPWHRDGYLGLNSRRFDQMSAVGSISVQPT